MREQVRERGEQLTRSQIHLIHRRFDAQKYVRWISETLIDCEPEISDPHVSLDVDENVGRLEIAMNNVERGEMKHR